MIEEAEHPFPPPEETSVNHRESSEDTIPEEEEEDPEEAEKTTDFVPEDLEGPKKTTDLELGDLGHKKTTDSVPGDMEEHKKTTDLVLEDAEDPMEDQRESHFAVSSSTGSDGETTGPSTAENSVSQAPSVDIEPKQVVGGRASIPDELEPHQLARLQDLKESNA